MYDQKTRTAATGRRRRVATIVALNTVRSAPVSTMNGATMVNILDSFQNSSANISP